MKTIPASLIGVSFTNGLRMTKKQEQFVLSRARYPLLYGGVRSGKTTALVWRAFLYSVMFPGNRGLLCRYTLTESKDTLLVEWEKAIPKAFYTIARDEGGWTITVKTSGAPSTVLVRPLSDRDRFSSAEFGWFGICQANDQYITLDLWNWLTSRLSWKLPDGTRPENTGFAEANSGAPWIIDMWGPERTNTEPGYEAIEISTFDNSDNLAPDYLESMRAKPEWWKAWALFPSWKPLTEFAGTPVFKGYFNLDRHVGREDVTPWPGWPIIRGWDLPGPIGTVWWQVNQRGTQVRVFHEQLAREGESITDVKNMVLHHSRLLFPKFTFTDYADPAAWTKSATDQRACIDYLEPEIHPQPGETLVERRLETARRWLTREQDTQEGLLIDRRCEYLVGGFAGGYAWKQVAGRTVLEPQKNVYSHVMDAFLHGLAAVTGSGLSRRQIEKIMGDGPLIPTWDAPESFVRHRR